MEQRLDRNDLRLLLACLAIAAASLAIGIPYFYRAFPEASIDFRITRDQARDQAAAFLEQRDLPTAGYRHAAAFQHDPEAKTFLERELGLEGATALIGRPVRLWRWSNRWVRELQKEEFRVEITTTGELVGFSHLIEEDRQGARLSEAGARDLAEQFLASLERDLDSLEFVESQAIERKNRMDYLFTWKLRDFEVHQATYRLSVGIQGDQVGSFAEFLKIPETWMRDYGELRSRNEAAGLVAILFLVLTWVALLASFIRSARQQEVRWKTALIFGLIALVLTFLSQLNELPVTIYGDYDTTATFGSFLTDQLLRGALLALVAGLSIAFLTAGAEPVYRGAYGRQLSLSHQFLGRGIRTKGFLMGSVIGLTLTAFFFAYQTLFYLAAECLGAWSPAEIPYSEMVNTYFPWVTVLLVGFFPAVSEEFTSRAFSIPFLEKLLKSRWAAVAISAFIWGFGHAGYPQQPFYIRGLEVGIGGLIVGAVMLRWGLLPTLTWHYTVDALYTALILLRSSNPYFVISAAISAGLLLVPLLVAAVFYLQRRAFADPTPLLNQAEARPAAAVPQPVPAAPAPEVPALVVAPLSARRLITAAAVLAAFSPLFFTEVEEPLDFIDFGLTPDQVARRAIEHLQTQGIAAGAYRLAVFQRHQLDPEVYDGMKYLLERQGLAGIDRLYQQDLQAVLWEARFYRPLQKEEYRVTVKPGDGAVRSLEHQVEEEAPGADLDEGAARALAESCLRDYGLDPVTLELKEASSEKLKARRDHRFVWEAGQGDPRNVDEARFRCEVKVAGDRPAALWRYLKLPEDWLRARRESTALRAVLKGTTIALFAAVFLHLLWLLIRQVRRGGLEWRASLLVGGLGGALFLAQQLNSLPTFYRAYDTAHTLTVFTITQLVGWALGFVGVGLLVFSGLALAAALYPRSLEYLRLSRWRGQFKDGLLLAGLALLAGKVHERLEALLSDHFAPHLLTPQLKLPAGLDTYLPFLQGLEGGLVAALALPIGAGIAAYYARRVLKRPIYILLAVVAIGALTAGASAVDAGEFWLGFSLFLLEVAFSAAVMVFLLRDHLPAYVLTGFLSSSIPAGLQLLRQSASFYQLNGALVLLGAGLALLGLWLWARRASQP